MKSQSELWQTSFWLISPRLVLCRFFGSFLETCNRGKIIRITHHGWWTTSHYFIKSRSRAELIKVSWLYLRATDQQGEFDHELLPVLVRRTDKNNIWWMWCFRKTLKTTNTETRTYMLSNTAYTMSVLISPSSSTSQHTLHQTLVTTFFSCPTWTHLQSPSKYVLCPSCVYCLKFCNICVYSSILIKNTKTDHTSCFFCVHWRHEGFRAKRKMELKNQTKWKSYTK